MNIAGSIINSYMICPRQAWMGMHTISGDKDNDFFNVLPIKEKIETCVNHI